MENSLSLKQAKILLFHQEQLSQLFNVWDVRPLLQQEASNNAVLTLCETIVFGRSLSAYNGLIALLKNKSNQIQKLIDVLQAASTEPAAKPPVILASEPSHVGELQRSCDPNVSTQNVVTTVSTGNLKESPTNENPPTSVDFVNNSSGPTFAYPPEKRLRLDMRSEHRVSKEKCVRNLSKSHGNSHEKNVDLVPGSRQQAAENMAASSENSGKASGGGDNPDYPIIASVVSVCEEQPEMTNSWVSTGNFTERQVDCDERSRASSDSLDIPDCRIVESVVSLCTNPPDNMVPLVSIRKFTDSKADCDVHSQTSSDSLDIPDCYIVEATVPAQENRPLTSQNMVSSVSDRIFDKKLISPSVLVPHKSNQNRPSSLTENVAPVICHKGAIHRIDFDHLAQLHPHIYSNCWDDLWNLRRPCVNLPLLIFPQDVFSNGEPSVAVRVWLDVSPTRTHVRIMAGYGDDALDRGSLFLPCRLNLICPQPETRVPFRFNRDHLLKIGPGATCYSQINIAQWRSKLNLQDSPVILIDMAR